MKTATEETDSPVEEGSLFKWGNLNEPIDASSNKHEKEYWIEVQPKDFKDDKAKPLKIAGKETTKLWDEITSQPFNTPFEKPRINGKEVEIANYDDYNVLYKSKDIEMGYGVLYGDEMCIRDRAYMTVQVTMPSVPGSRSNTVEGGGSNVGVEIGKDYENNVKRMYVVLARSTDNAFIAFGDMSDKMKQSANKQAYIGTSEITKTQLSQFYNDTETPTDKKEVNVFIFCNPTDELVELISKTEYKNTTWYNAICKGDDKELGKIWSKNEGGSFLMSNYSIAKRLLPNTMNDWLLYNEATPFNLSGINNAGSLSQVDNSVGGAVKVERAMARFDFRDGSRSLPENIRPQEGNTYPVVQDIAPDGTPGAYIVNVQLGKMALVNMNNSFYYLRRVSDNGLPAQASLCSPEKPWFTVAGGGERCV